MADRVMLSDADTERVTEAARLLMSVIHKMAPAELEGTQKQLFGASVAVQAVTRATLDGLRDDGLAVQALIHAAEGLGSMIGLIPSLEARQQVFVSVMRAMSVGMDSQAQIHVPAGEA